MAYTNSSLVTYTKLSQNKTAPREHAIDTITIHCVVGQWTAKQGCDYFYPSSVNASPNYFVGKDGSIGLCVEEKNRSWCSGGTLTVNGINGKANDHRAVTIEVASDLKSPYAVTDAAYNALIKLVADIAKRNNIKKLLWKADKSLVGKPDQQTFTVHQWFANKACPGQYLYERHGDIADKANKILGVTTSQNSTSTTPKTTSTSSYMVKVTANELNIRKEASASSAITGTIKDHGVYTIVEEKMNGNTKWGKLKSGLGYISLYYTERV